MAEKMRRMPFRDPLKRDVWSPSERAMEIGKEWEQIKKSGGNISFSNDSDSETIPDKLEASD